MTMLTTKNDIQAWLSDYGVKKYTINEDLSVDVRGDVNLANQYLKSISVQFNYVSGGFDCYDNQLASLLGAPRSVDGRFNCSYNELTSLLGAPQRVGGNFSCSFNSLTSLEYGPDTVEGLFYCKHNQLTSLEFLPNVLGPNFYCAYNPELGQFQEIDDFAVIKAEHLRIQAILDEQKKLNDLLSTNSNIHSALFKL